MSRLLRFCLVLVGSLLLFPAKLPAQTYVDPPGTSRAPTAVTAGTRGFLPLNPDNGAVFISPPTQWSVVHTPATNAQATASKAAGGAGVRHVATGVTACIGGAALLTAANGVLNLRDGATGAGTIIWTAYLQNAANIANCLTFPLHLPGTANTAMTLEFAGAGGTNNQESVTLMGYSIQ